MENPKSNNQGGRRLYGNTSTMNPLHPEILDAGGWDQHGSGSRGLWDTSGKQHPEGTHERSWRAT
eukprot:12937628-Prorocentrum_lima.AAC.1